MQKFVTLNPRTRDDRPPMALIDVLRHATGYTPGSYATGAPGPVLCDVVARLIAKVTDGTGTHLIRHLNEIVGSPDYVIVQAVDADDDTASTPVANFFRKFGADPEPDDDVLPIPNPPAYVEIVNDYDVRMTWDREDGGWVAEALALKGCVSQGRTRKEAKENVVEAIGEWLAAEKDRDAALTAATSPFPPHGQKLSETDAFPLTEARDRLLKEWASMPRIEQRTYNGGRPLTDDRTAEAASAVTFTLVRNRDQRVFRYLPMTRVLRYANEKFDHEPPTAAEQAAAVVLSRAFVEGRMSLDDLSVMFHGRAYNVANYDIKLPDAKADVDPKHPGSREAVQTLTSGRTPAQVAALAAPAVEAMKPDRGPGPKHPGRSDPVDDVASPDPVLSATVGCPKVPSRMHTFVAFAPGDDDYVCVHCGMKMTGPALENARNAFTPAPAPAVPASPSFVRYEDLSAENRAEIDRQYPGDPLAPYADWRKDPDGRWVWQNTGSRAAAAEHAAPVPSVPTILCPKAADGLHDYAPIKNWTPPSFRCVQCGQIIADRDGGQPAKPEPKHCGGGPVVVTVYGDGPLDPNVKAAIRDTGAVVERRPAKEGRDAVAAIQAADEAEAADAEKYLVMFDYVVNGTAAIDARTIRGVTDVGRNQVRIDTTEGQYVVRGSAVTVKAAIPAGVLYEPDGDDDRPFVAWEYLTAVEQANVRKARPEAPDDVLRGRAWRYEPVRDNPFDEGRWDWRALNTAGATWGPAYVRHGESFVVNTEAPPSDDAASTDPRTGVTDTHSLVLRFADALLQKLNAKRAEKGDGWMEDGWKAACQKSLMEHAGKGDPLDVAAFAAFCWYHQWPTTDPSKTYVVQADDFTAADAKHFRDAWDVGEKWKRAYAGIAALIGVGEGARNDGPKVLAAVHDLRRKAQAAEPAHKLLDDVAYALQMFAHTARHGHPTIGGEQNGNSWCVEDAYRKLKAAYERVTGAKLPPYGPDATTNATRLTAAVHDLLTRMLDPQAIADEVWEPLTALRDAYNVTFPHAQVKARKDDAASRAVDPHPAEPPAPRGMSHHPDADMGELLTTIEAMQAAGTTNAYRLRIAAERVMVKFDAMRRAAKVTTLPRAPDRMKHVIDTGGMDETAATSAADNLRKLAAARIPVGDVNRGEYPAVRKLPAYASSPKPAVPLFRVDRAERRWNPNTLRHDVILTVVTNPESMQDYETEHGPDVLVARLGGELIDAQADAVIDPETPVTDDAPYTPMQPTGGMANKPTDPLAELDALRKFKSYVHERLDAAGVPADPDPAQNEKTGCRIGGRLDYALRGLGVQVTDDALDDLFRSLWAVCDITHSGLTNPRPNEKTRDMLRRAMTVARKATADPVRPRLTIAVPSDAEADQWFRDMVSVANGLFTVNPSDGTRSYVRTLYRQGWDAAYKAWCAETGV